VWTENSRSGMILSKSKIKDFEVKALPQLEGLYRTAIYVLGNKSIAEDLVQESFVRAYQSWRHGQIGPNYRVWLFKIMTNILITKYWPSRGLSEATNCVDEIDGYLLYSQWLNRRPIDGQGKVPFSTISDDQIRKAVGELPRELRLIIVLSLLEGFSYREIADIAGINLETVKSRLHQGRKLIQRELFESAECEGEYDMLANRVRSSKSG
jgi:RNA polymerase sigma-70 factor, ECF subfamily